MFGIHLLKSGYRQFAYSASRVFAILYEIGKWCNMVQKAQVPRRGPGARCWTQTIKGHTKAPQGTFAPQNKGNCDAVLTKEPGSPGLCTGGGTSPKPVFGHQPGLFWCVYIQDGNLTQICACLGFSAQPKRARSSMCHFAYFNTMVFYGPLVLATTSA